MALWLDSVLVVVMRPPRPDEGMINAMLSISFCEMKFCSSRRKNCDFDQILKMVATQ